jgi:ferritin-like metal-binding protein YciE
MQANALRELYLDELRNLYSAEGLLVKALPKLAKASTSPELKAGFEHHLEQTKGHVTRLEEIFNNLGERPADRTKACKG